MHGSTRRWSNPHAYATARLTLPEVALNLGLACGIGFWVAGIVGASVGAAVVVGRYVFLIGDSI